MSDSDEDDSGDGDGDDGYDGGDGDDHRNRGASNVIERAQFINKWPNW